MTLRDMAGVDIMDAPRWYADEMDAETLERIAERESAAGPEWADREYREYLASEHVEAEASYAV